MRATGWDGEPLAKVHEGDCRQQDDDEPEHAGKNGVPRAGRSNHGSLCAGLQLPFQVSRRLPSVVRVSLEAPLDYAVESRRQVLGLFGSLAGQHLR